MSTFPKRRRFRLIRPDLQIRFGIAFAAVAACALVLQALVLSYSLNEVIGIGPNGKTEIANVSRFVLVNGLATAAFALPFALVVGAITLFPIAGPLHHVEQHLERFLRGEERGRCTLREGDRLYRLAFLVDAVISRARKNEPVASGSESSASSGAALDVDDVPSALPSEPEYEETPEYLS